MVGLQQVVRQAGPFAVLLMPDEDVDPLVECVSGAASRGIPGAYLALGGAHALVYGLDHDRGGVVSGLAEMEKTSSKATRVSKTAERWGRRWVPGPEAEPIDPVAHSPAFAQCHQRRRTDEKQNTGAS
jgi:hypothetical protein